MHHNLFLSIKSMSARYFLVGMFWQSIRIRNRLSQDLRRQRALLSPPVSALPGGGVNESVAAISAVSETTPDKALKKIRVAGQGVPEVVADIPDYTPEIPDYTPEIPEAEEFPTPKKKLEESFREATVLGQTGDTPDHVVALQVDNSNLQCANTELHERVADLQDELKKAIEALQKKSSGPVEPPVEPKNPQPPVPPQNPDGSDGGLEALGETHVGDDAARKRLERLCKRKANGKLVPKFINDLSQCFEEGLCSTIHVIKNIVKYKFCLLI